MFDLNTAVEEWSHDFAGRTCGRNDRREELKDHLFCEIEKNIGEGLGEESAFLAATRRFGISEDIKAEFRGGRTISAILCDAERGWWELNTKQMAIATGIFLVSFAALTFGLTFLLNGTEYERFLSPILYILMFVPIVFSTLSYKQKGAECTFFKKLIKKGF